MSDPQSRLAEYQRQAEACTSKAKRAADKAVRSQYKRLADTYLQMVDMERRRMEIRGKLKSDRA